jgi:hypothetical protein
MADCVRTTLQPDWVDYSADYMKDSGQAESESFYDLPDDMFGSDHSTEEAFPFSGTASGEFSSECTTPTPHDQTSMMPHGDGDTDSMIDADVKSEIFCRDDGHIFASAIAAVAALKESAAIGCMVEHSAPLLGKSSDGAMLVDAAVSMINNPYAKPRMTFRSGGPSPRVTRPAAAAHASSSGGGGGGGGGHAAPASSPAHQVQQAASSFTAAAARPRSKAAPRPPVVGKQHKLCYYDLCPSPMQSNKWRTVTQGTAAGGQVWDALVGKMLCDSCYSTFRKHGTLVRSVRTPDGWARLDGDGTVYRPNQPKNVRKRGAAASAADASKRKKATSTSSAQEHNSKQHKTGDAVEVEWDAGAKSQTSKASAAGMLHAKADDAALSLRDDARSFSAYSDDGGIAAVAVTSSSSYMQQQQSHAVSASGGDAMGSGVPHWYQTSAAYLADNIAAC